MIGVLDIHGDVEEHITILKKINAPCKRIKLPEEIDSITGLIIPGGESTTMARLMDGLSNKIKEKYLQGTLSLFGTCAGAILLAKKIVDYPEQKRLNLLDITIKRNAYGRQLQSFTTTINGINAAFIRAPIIEKVGKNVEVLLSYNTPVLVREGKIIASTFHPEIMGDTTVHEMFVTLK